MPKKKARILGHISFLIRHRPGANGVRVALDSIQFDDDGRMSSFRIPVRIDRG